MAKPLSLVLWIDEPVPLRDQRVPQETQQGTSGV